MHIPGETRDLASMEIGENRYAEFSQDLFSTRRSNFFSSASLLRDVGLVFTFLRYVKLLLRER